MIAVNATSPTISMVTTCKGREAALCETLFASAEGLVEWCGFLFTAEIVVVDFDSPRRDVLMRLCREVGHRLREGGRVSLSVVHVTDEPHWRSGLAKNVGIRHTHGGADYVACVDADIALSGTWHGNAVEAVNRKHIATCDGPNDAKGSMMFPRRMLLDTRGYEERWPVATWCQDDLEIRERWLAMGWPTEFCGVPRLVVPHTDALRFQFSELRGETREDAVERGRTWMDVLRARWPDNREIVPANVGREVWGRAAVSGVEVLS